MYRKHVGCAGLAALILASPAFAHHPSGVGSTGGAGPIATISASTLEQGHSAAAIFFEMVKINPFSDTELKTFAGKHIHAHSLDAILAPTLIYAYGVTNDLTIIGRLPVVTRKDIREGHHSHGPAGNTVDERGDSSGIGDLTLLGMYRFYNNKATRTEATLLLGVKAPTGRTNEYDALGERFEAEFQPGSGSWDGLFGMAFTQRFTAWSFDANVLYQQVNKGTQDTDLGDRFNYNAAVSYRMTGGPATPVGRMNLGAMPEPMYHGGPKARGHKHTHKEPAPPPGPALDLVLELNGEWHGHEKVAGVKEENSGGNVVYLSPGVRLSMDKWSGFVSVGIPVVNHVNGVQAEPSWRLLTGIAVSF
jgi:Putative MetA-pathway of phenol degradation